jgi:hypothetical protein
MIAPAMKKPLLNCAGVFHLSTSPMTATIDETRSVSPNIVPNRRRIDEFWFSVTLSWREKRFLTSLYVFRLGT